MNKHWISHGPTSLQHVLMTLKKQTLVLLFISYTLKFGKASHQLKHGRDQQPCTFYSPVPEKMTRLFYFSSASYCTVLCISNHPMLGTLKAQMHRPHLLAEQKKGASTRFWTMVSCTNYTSSSCTLVSAENYHVKKRKRKEKYPQPSTNLSSPSPSQLKGERSCLVALNKYTPCNLSKIDHGHFCDRTMLDISSICSKETTQHLVYPLA